MNPAIKCQSSTLPDNVAKGVLNLTEVTGQKYGAADFWVTPEGQHIFLELNPAVLFIQNVTGMPMADLLITGQYG